MAEASVVNDRAGALVQQGATQAKRAAPPGPTIVSIIAQWQQTIGNRGVAQLSAMTGVAPPVVAEEVAAQDGTASDGAETPAATADARVEVQPADAAGAAPGVGTAGSGKLRSDVAEAAAANQPGVIEMEPLVITGSPKAPEHPATQTATTNTSPTNQPGVIEMEPLVITGSPKAPEHPATQTATTNTRPTNQPGVIEMEPLVITGSPKAPEHPVTTGALTAPVGGGPPTSTKSAPPVGLTTPGFVERNAALTGKAKGVSVSGAATQGPRTSPPHSAGGAPGKGGAHQGSGKGGHKPSLGDPSLDKWKAAVGAGTAAVNPGEPVDASAGAGAVATKGKELAGSRTSAQPDPAADAKSHQPPLPKEAPKVDRLDTTVADSVIEATAKAGTQRLKDQSFAPFSGPPKYSGAELTGSDYVPKNFRSEQADLEKQLAGVLADESKRPLLTKQLDDLKKKIAGIEQAAGQGPAAEPPKAIHDEAPAALTPPNPAMGDVLGDAIARAMQKVSPTAEQIVKSAVTAAHGDKVPKMLEMATAEQPTLEQDLRVELTGIATAAGVSKEQLDAKVIEQQDVVKKQTEAAEKAVHDSSTTAVTTRQEQTTKEGQAIGGAKAAVQQEIADKQAAADGPPDTKAIEAKRDELLTKLETTGATATAALQSSINKRNTDLDAGATEKKQKIAQAANNQAAAIRRHWANDPDPNKGMVEARPTTDWGSAESGHVDAEVKQLKQAATAEHDSFVVAVNAQLQPGRDRIRDWAAHQEGRERSWWERLLDMFHDWGHQATANNEAWEKQRNAESRDAMAKDLDVLADLKKAQLDKSQEEYTAALSKLTKEQRQLANKYLAGGIDSIGFVAESTMMRIGSRRKPEMAKTFEERAIAEWDWESLGQLARATNPGFQPKVLANKVHGGVDGWGTNEAKVYEGLGGAKTAIERAALDKCYMATFGASMAEDVRDDMSDKELDRAEALMSGDSAKADAATIAEAVDGLGTDEKAIRDALRGKTPEELDAIKKAYREKYGVDLVADLRDDMEGAELDNALALAEGDTDKADAAELEDAMAGPGTDEDKMKQVYERIREEEQRYALSHGLTKAELDQRVRDRNARVAGKYAAMGYGDLKANAKDELSDGDPLSANNADNKLFDALQAGDESKIDAAKALVEREGVYTSDDEVEKIVRNQRKKAEFDVNLEAAAEKARLQALAGSSDLSPDEYKAGMAQFADTPENKAKREAEIQRRGKANVAALKADYEGLANTDVSVALHGKETFDSLVEEGTSGYSQSEINALLESGGKLSPEQEIYYAVAGVGTDEDKIKETLKDKTPKEVAEIRKNYERLHGEGSFDSDILGDLSGREDLDVGLTLKYGDPSTFARQLDEAKPEDRAALLAGFQKYLETRRDFEKSGNVGAAMDLFGDGMNSADQLEDAITRAKDYDAALRKAESTPGYDPKNKGNDPNLVAAQANFDMNFQGAVQAQEEVREKIDAITDVAAQIGGAIAGIAVTVLTAGTAGPAVLALYAAAASAATSIALKMSMKGAAYGWEDLGTDLAIGVVDGAMSYATAGLGKAVMASLERAVASQALKLAAEEGAEKMTESAVKAFLKEAIEEGIQNGIQAVPSAFVGGVLNGEDPLTAARGAGMAGLQGAGMGIGIHGATTAGGAAFKGIKGSLKNEPTIETGGTGGHVEEPHSKSPSDVEPKPATSMAEAPTTPPPEIDLPPAADPKAIVGALEDGKLPPDVHVDEGKVKAASPEPTAHEGAPRPGEPGTRTSANEPINERMRSPEEIPTTETAGPGTAAEKEIGKPLSNEELATKHGMPEDNVNKIKAICASEGVVIDVRPTTPYAEPMLREGTALPKPEKLKAKTINELDVQLGLGGGEHNLGKVGFFPPEDIRFPENFDSLPPEHREALIERAKMRSEEFNANSHDMAELLDKGKIRLEPDGTITNTGLIEGGQKPFTGDHDVFDIRRADGTQLSPAEYDAVKKRLIEADCDVMHGAVTRWGQDSPTTFNTPQGQESYGKMVANHSPGGKEPLIRFGDGEPKSVWHEPATEPRAGAPDTERSPSSGAPDTERSPDSKAPDTERSPDSQAPKTERTDPRDTLFDDPDAIQELPSGASMTFEGGEFADSKLMYDNSIAATPDREVAMMRNRVTGEYVVIQGRIGEVDIHHSNFGELFPDHPNDWELLRHSHSVADGGPVPTAKKLPSGNDGDLSVIMARAERFGERQVSMIDFVGPNGPEHTTFGYDPKSKEFFVTYPGPDGSPRSMAFSSLEDYHTWYEKEFPGYKAGEPIRAETGEVGPDPERVKANEKADEASGHNSDGKAPIAEPTEHAAPGEPAADAVAAELAPIGIEPAPEPAPPMDRAAQVERIREVANARVEDIEARLVDSRAEHAVNEEQIKALNRQLAAADGTLRPPGEEQLARMSTDRRALWEARAELIEQNRIGIQERERLGQQLTQWRRAAGSDIIQERYSELRPRTPGSNGAGVVIEANGVDVTGRAGTPENPLRADHVVPVLEIVAMDNFVMLPDEVALAILNDPQYMRALNHSANSSKADWSWRDWPQAANHVPGPVRQQMIELEDQLRQEIYDRIQREFARQRNGAGVR